MHTFRRSVTAALFCFSALVSPTAAQSYEQQRAEPRAVRFVPFVVKVSFRVAPGPVVSECAVALVGNPDPHWLDNPCGNIASSAFLRMIGVNPQTEGRMTSLLTLQADGRTADTGVVAGRLMFRTEARFQLGAGGAISRCAMGDSVGTGGQVNLCQLSFPRRPNPFPPAAENGRLGLLSLSFYLER